jgi:hypothetical protein
MTDLLRPAYRALMRKHVSTQLDSTEPVQPLEVQLISGDDRERGWSCTASGSRTAGGMPHRRATSPSQEPRGFARTRQAAGANARSNRSARGDHHGRNGTIDYMNEAAEQLIGGTRSAGEASSFST